MKASRQARLLLTDRDRRVLTLAWRFRLLSRDQFMLLAPFGSLTRANTRLAALVRARLLSRKLLPVYPGQGGVQTLYFPGNASSDLLHAEPEAQRRLTRRIHRWDLGQVEHVVAANQVLSVMLAALGPQALSFRTEPELRQVFSDCRLVPDGWLAFETRGKAFNCFLEVDLHHEGLTEWRGKVLRYLEYAESRRHQELFGFRSVRVLVLARSTRRLDHVRRIAEQAGRLFLFAEMDAVDTRTVLNPVWLPATGSTRIRLTEA